MGNLKVLKYDKSTFETQIYYKGLCKQLTERYRIKRSGMYYCTNDSVHKAFIVTCDGDTFEIPAKVFIQRLNNLNRVPLTKKEVLAFNVLWKYLTPWQRSMYFNNNSMIAERKTYAATAKKLIKKRLIVQDEIPVIKIQAVVDETSNITINGTDIDKWFDEKSNIAKDGAVFTNAMYAQSLARCNRRKDTVTMIQPPWEHNYHDNDGDDFKHVDLSTDEVNFSTIMCIAIFISAFMIALFVFMYFK